ncbi:MFS general substrate transporter [Aspergillus stella-maris]|uniref:MFS general substrate transporter n=1 Tax=Aspergillus stella-maris TaxID=1810926 RepID=UPI003CCDA9A5
MHLTMLNSWGVSNSFGVFQTYYTDILPQTPSSISWIGGLLGIFMTSLCKTYWQIMLSQAVAVGIGNGRTFTSGLSVMSSYFVQNRAFAVGVAASGSAVGGLIYPITVACLLNVLGIGYGWTLRVMGLDMLVTSIPSLTLFKPRLPPRKTGPLIDSSAVHEIPFVFFTLSKFFNFWGLYFAFFYLGTFARDILGVSPSSSMNYILVLNGIGVFGRIIPGLIADKRGMLNMIIILSLSASILLFSWIRVSTESGLYAFASVYGIIAAALQTLFPATATTMAPFPERTGTRLGMILSFVGFATLTGPAIEGALIQEAGGDYIYGQVFAGTAILLGCGAAVVARVAKVGWGLDVRA